MPKKPQINPFSMYLREQEPLLRRRGLEFNSKAEVVSYLHPHFRALSDFDRQKYVNMAKMEKEVLKHDLTRKFDDRGVPLSQIEAEKREQREQFESMCAHIVRLVQERTGGGDSLLSVKFYTMFCTEYCHTDEGTRSVHLPCEMAVCEWTLADGVLRTLSFVVRPDHIPSGYKFMCRQICESTHRIELDHADAEASYPALWIRLRNFINPGDSLDEYPPVFTLAGGTDRLERCLDWLHARAADRRHSPFRVYRLELLLFELLQQAGHPQLEAQCADALSSSQYNHETEIACRYHGDDDNSLHCARAMAQRCAYLLLQLVAPLFGVQPQPGRHLPRPLQLPVLVDRAPAQPAASSARLSPIAFRPARQREPNLPTEYTLIESTRSKFADIAWDASECASPAPRVTKQQQQQQTGSDVTVAPRWGLCVDSAPARLDTDDFPALGAAGRGRGSPNIDSGPTARGIGRGKRFQ